MTVTWARLRCPVVWWNTSAHVAEKVFLRREEHFNQQAEESRSASNTLKENASLGNVLSTKELSLEGRPCPRAVAVGRVRSGRSFPPALGGLPPWWPGDTCRSGTERDCDTGRLLGADGMSPRQTQDASEVHASALF